MRHANRTLVAIFLAVITIPGIGLVLGWDPQTISESERRELVKFPEWSEAATTTAWIGDFQRYFEDHFSFRNRLIGWHSALLWYGLHTFSSNTVIAGKGNWIFYADDGSLVAAAEAEVGELL